MPTLSRVSGSSPLNIISMVPLHVTRIVWLLVASPMCMTLTIPRRSPSSFVFTLFTHSSLSPSIRLVPPLVRYFLTPFFMVILRSRSFWSNLLGMLLKGSHPRCVSYNELFTGSSRVHVLGLQSLVVFSLPFGFTLCDANSIVLTKKTKGNLVILVV